MLFCTNVRKGNDEFPKITACNSSLGEFSKTIRENQNPWEKR